MDEDMKLADRVKDIVRPLAKAVHEAGAIEYIETVTCVSTQSADKEVKSHIDEFINEISHCLSEAGVCQSKSILLMNPARPPVCMTNTIYLKVKNADRQKITDGILNAAGKLEQRIPDFHLRTLPIIEENRITVVAEGGGD